ncbi:MAG TPA: dTDP-4-amino-4,6-dideoxygalactose transaminase [Thermoanaerobaculia bacterium]|nr:dTDP-4-amino-4,6-dideoxygalactose transaminase [Thermoanaerobaculia bacterium]
MTSGRIPFNRPSMVGNELEYIAEAVRGGHLAGDGVFARRCEAWLQQQCESRRVLLTPSCTAALELAALLCEVGEGDEVIMPSFTFVSTANAFVLRGATPVFVDIRPDTLNIDEQLIESAITPRTKVIVPVHYAGVACEMETIQRIASHYRLRIVEDAAQALGATWRGRSLGTFGDLGCWSFHETKNFISGEGGALAIQDPMLIERAEIIREKGTDRSKFFRGQVDKYSWVDLGSSFLPSELVAAFLYAQLEHAQEILNARREIFALYLRELEELEAAGLVRLPRVPADCEPNGHLFYLLLPDETTRDSLLAFLNDAGVNSVFHYVSLHESQAGRRYGRVRGSMSHTESASRRLLRLPCYNGLQIDEQVRVVECIMRFFRANANAVRRFA